MLILIDSDAHGAETLANLKYGVGDRPSRVVDAESGSEYAAVGGVQIAPQTRSYQLIHSRPNP